MSLVFIVDLPSTELQLADRHLIVAVKCQTYGGFHLSNMISASVVTLYFTAPLFSSSVPITGKTETKKNSILFLVTLLLTFRLEEKSKIHLKIVRTPTDHSHMNIYWMVLSNKDPVTITLIYVTASDTRTRVDV